MLTGGMMTSEYASAPILFYPPPPSTEYLPATGARVTSYSPSPEPQPFSRPPPLNQQRNRKRSRDQTEDDEREAVFQELNTMDTAMPEPEPEPIYGEGMVLINPRTGQPVGSDASSGTGTWCEEQAEAERLASVAAAEQQKRDEDEMAKAINRPIKAQRLDLSRIHGSLDGSPTTAPGMLEPAPLTPTTPASPLYDEAAMMLGVGWRKVEGSGDVALAGASKGWAKFVNNHFANLSNCEILAKSEGKEAFLIKAQDSYVGAEGFFLFDDCLEHGQLLGCDIQTAVGNLQAGLFAGQLLTARRSTSPEPVQLPTPSVEIAMEM